MVYKYVRKTNQASWSEEAMRQAILECRGGSSIRSMSIKYSIPRITLYRHVKSGSTEKKLGRFKTIFTIQQETDLCNYLKKMDSLFFGLSRQDFKRLAFDFAKKNKIQYPLSWNKYSLAGDEWLIAFQKRNPQIVLRTPEPTSVARVRGFNRTQVTRFYDILEQVLQEHNIGPDSLYNMDETGIMTTTNKPPKVLSISGKKQVGVISSTERGKLTTVICCCNATGSFVPPFMIFARKRMQERLLDGAPPGTQATCTSNGWTHGESFLLWLKFFIQYVRPSENKHVVLLLDNHESHKYYPALEYASEHHVTFVSYPPHTTHKLQALDVAVYGPIKKYFEQEINTFQKQHPGRIINQYDVAKLFREAYLKGASPRNGVNGFVSSGTWPFNRNLFDEADFAPADAISTNPNGNEIDTDGNIRSHNNNINKTQVNVNPKPEPSKTELAIAGPSNKKPSHVRQLTDMWLSSGDEASNEKPIIITQSLINKNEVSKQMSTSGRSNVKPLNYFKETDWSSSDDEPLVQKRNKECPDFRHETPMKFTVSCNRDTMSFSFSATKQNVEHEASPFVAYFSPNDVRPLPTVATKKNTAKAKVGQSRNIN